MKICEEIKEEQNDYNRLCDLLLKNQSIYYKLLAETNNLKFMMEELKEGAKVNLGRRSDAR